MIQMFARLSPLLEMFSERANIGWGWGGGGGVKVENKLCSFDDV